MLQMLFQLSVATVPNPSVTSADTWIEQYLSPWMKDEFLDVAYWQWGLVLAAILAGLVVDVAVRFVLRRVLRQITDASSDADGLAQIMRAVPRPAGLAAGGGVWLFLMPMLGLPQGLIAFLGPVVSVYITAACIWFGFKGTDLIAWVAAEKARKTENKLDDLLVPLLRKTLKATVFVFGIIYLASSLQIQLAPIIAGLGIGGLGFAFAAKDTIENFFGSITVILDTPFGIGDWVVIDGVEGTVESVGIRSTRVRTFYDTVVTIPNSILVTTKCNNYSARRYRRWKQMIGIGYATPPDKIAAFCEGIRELLRVHPYTRKDYYQVWLNGFASSSLDVLVYVFWTAPDWQTELRERHRFMLDIIRLAGDLGVEFAFPSRTVYLRKEENWDKGPEKISAIRPEGWMETAEDEGRELVEEFTAEDDWRKHLPPPYRFTGAKDGGGGGSDGGEG